MHPRISVSQVSSWNWSLDDDLSFWDAAGIDAVGITLRKLAGPGDPDSPITDRLADAEAAALRIVDAGLRVTNLLVDNPFTLDDRRAWVEQGELLGMALDVAKVLRPEVIVVPCGRAGSMAWERAADALEEALRGTLREAERDGVRFLLEFTNPLRTDVSFVHTLRDTIELGWRLGTGACMEITACWYERNLVGTLHAGIDAIGLVQLADYAIGTHDTPNRLVPGDGDIPFERILKQLLEAGYEGMFDLELVGPRIEEEGYGEAIGRSLRWLEELFEEIGLGEDADDREAGDGRDDTPALDVDDTPDIDREPDIEDPGDTPDDDT